ncbi:50S ribosomal protein L24 [Candidatus Jorgensenbacteria bacterium RIFCSPLOWO2_01_FULL_45_25b]|uniref:Large ribosomal subunit protein uL24 n=1 Tax=Candidatus Jorgensenbacteria bacterium RIFCSPLOWO2_01_FULL_45_25b TaxID=1798471 RepID=A0A1F6BV44_9BACT|nr:MAG: 50S ribosomal protein L24 [Candidatus Jorgensenbacteria bacterium RIFCSPLOWO2_01_FULL_45_25b]
MRIKKGDVVKIITGKNRGKTGKVVGVHKEGTVSVEGMNLYKKHLRPKKEGEKGQIVELSRPVKISNIMLVCSGCKKQTRVGHKEEKGKKVRICKKCKAIIRHVP